MGVQQEREAARRKEKLAAIDEQIRAGTLVVRKMTPEERERYGAPRPVEGKGSRKRGARR